MSRLKKVIFTLRLFKKSLDADKIGDKLEEDPKELRKDSGDRDSVKDTTQEVQSPSLSGDEEPAEAKTGEEKVASDDGKRFL